MKSVRVSGWRGVTLTTLMMLLVAGGIWTAGGQRPVAAAEAEQLQAVASMQELMTRVVQPTSDAVFYVSRTPPETDEDWRRLENQTLMLAESANLLLIPGYVRESQQWLTDSLLMRNAAVAAYQAAQNKNMVALEELNGALYESCESCHTATR